MNTRARFESAFVLVVLAAVSGPVGGCGCASSPSVVGGSGGLGGASGGATGTGSTGSGGSGEGCPEGGFVTLTYDDSLSSHLTNAVPALDAHGFLGTFFLTTVPAGSTAWKGVKATGHELGAHTRNHPCPASNAWVPEGNANEDYDLERMATELDDQLVVLAALGQEAPYTFAYPCGVEWVGEEQTSYVPLVEERFRGARGVVGGRVISLDAPYRVPAYFLTGAAETLINQVDQAMSQGAWIVFGFHGVGGDHTPIALEDHEALLEHLDTNGIPVRTFGAGIACMEGR